MPTYIFVWLKPCFKIFIFLYLNICFLSIGSAQIIDTAILGEREVIYEVLNNNHLQFKWEVEDGYIMEGQGSSKIKVNWAYSGGLKKISVYARPLGNCLPDTSVAYIWVMELESVFLPTSFTPNGDGLNDIFIPMVNTIGIKNYDLTIVNRWGQIVFKSNNPQFGWDGTNSMGQSLEGVFTCMLELQKENGYRFSTTQLITILR